MSTVHAGEDSSPTPASSLPRIPSLKRSPTIDLGPFDADNPTSAPKIDLSFELGSSTVPLPPQSPKSSHQVDLGHFDSDGVEGLRRSMSIASRRRALSVASPRTPQLPQLGSETEGDDESEMSFDFEHVLRDAVAK